MIVSAWLTVIGVGRAMTTEQVVGSDLVCLGNKYGSVEIPAF